MAQPGRRPLFGPLVLLGLAGAALTATAGSKQMVRADEDALRDLPVPAELIARLSSASDLQGAGAGVVSASGDLPLVAGLGLVVLACWGVLLVTRGRVRIAVTALTLLASAGALAALIVGMFSVADSHAEAVASQLGLDLALVDEVVVNPTGWFAAACVGAVVAVLAAALALPRVGSWPAMGGRYDAPGAAGPTAATAEEPSNLDLWKAMDRGDDPTT